MSEGRVDDSAAEREVKKDEVIETDESLFALINETSVSKLNPLTERALHMRELLVKAIAGAERVDCSGSAGEMETESS